MIPVNDLKRGFNLYQKEYEDKALEVLRSGWYVLGKEVESFENEFKSFLGAKYCIGVDNGTNAIVLGIKCLGIGVGDEVIVAANTYIATALGVSLNGATPVFVDCNEYYNIDYSLIESHITDRTRAILVTHLYGQACRMEPIVSICKNHELYLLEDCAQAHGAEFDGKKVGTIGDMGFFSFYPTKNLGGFGDGGAIVTNNKELADQLRMMRNYGSKIRYHCDFEGHNSRLDELQAGLLRVKLAHFNELARMRSIVAQRYLTEITNPYVTLPKIDDGCSHIYHLFVVDVSNRERFRGYLQSRGVSTDVHYPIPPYRAKAYCSLGCNPNNYPVCDRLVTRIVSIPIFDGIFDEEVGRVIEAINDYAE